MQRKDRLEITLSAEEKAAIAQAANREHYKPAPWARAVLLAASRRHMPVQVGGDGREGEGQ